MPVDEQTVRLKLGQAIRQIRQGKGLSQEQVAFDAGLSATYVSLVEQGHRNITVYRLALLAEAMGTTTEELLKTASL